jgi:putative colanic acid biosynthesis UDP-glucose lipid carrier transferase
MTVNDIPLISFFQRVLDPLIIMGTLYLSALLFHEPFSGYMLVLMILAFFISSAVYQHIDPYRTWRSGRMWAYARDTIFGWGVTLAVLWFLGSSSGLKYYYDERVLLAWAIATPAILLTSHIAARLANSPGRSKEVRSVVVVGANDVGLKFARVVEQASEPVHGGARLLRRPHRRPPFLPACITRCWARPGSLTQYVREHGIKMIFISQPISAQPRIRKLIDELQDTTASVYFLPDVYIFDLMQARFDNVGGMPVIAICETPFMGLNSTIKRASDIVLASLILLLLAPLMLVVAIAVRVSSPGPVIFRQRRYGLYGEEIIVYKFRSMSVMENGNTAVVQAQKNDGA